MNENPEITRLEEILMNEDYDPREKTTIELANESGVYICTVEQMQELANLGEEYYQKIGDEDGF